MAMVRVKQPKARPFSRPRSPPSIKIRLRHTVGGHAHAFVDLDFGDSDGRALGLVWIVKDCYVPNYASDYIICQFIVFEA